MVTRKVIVNGHSMLCFGGSSKDRALVDALDLMFNQGLDSYLAPIEFCFGFSKTKTKAQGLRVEDGVVELSADPFTSAMPIAKRVRRAVKFCSTMSLAKYFESLVHADVGTFAVDDPVDIKALLGDLIVGQAMAGESDDRRGYLSIDGCRAMVVRATLCGPTWEFDVEMKP